MLRGAWDQEKERDWEKIVLSRAIWNHMQRKTLVFENRKIVVQ